MTSWRPQGVDRPGYQALVASLQQDIQSGRLRAGERLPAVGDAPRAVPGADHGRDAQGTGQDGRVGGGAADFGHEAEDQPRVKAGHVRGRRRPLVRAERL